MNIVVLNKRGNICDTWCDGRPHLDKNKEYPSRNEVLRMNLPVLGFESYELQITSTILFRDLLLTIRPITAWTISNRAQKFNKNDLKVGDAELLSKDEYTYIDASINECIRRVDSGEKQDYVKEDLPQMTQTRMNVSIDLRTLVNFVYTLMVHIPEYGKLTYKSLPDFIRSDYDLMTKVDLWDKVSVSENEMNIINNKEFSSLGDMHLLGGNLQCNLMAQFIRQHSSTVKNGLWNKCSESFDTTKMSTQKGLVPVLAYIPKSAYDNIMSVRTCWFAQMDKSTQGSWAYVLDPLVQKLSVEQFMKQLPCHGNKSACKIAKEMRSRVERVDVNPPCPILLDNPSIINDRIQSFKSNSIIMDKWSELASMIKIDPNNELNKEYYEVSK